MLKCLIKISLQKQTIHGMTSVIFQQKIMHHIEKGLKDKMCLKFFFLRKR